MGALVSCLIENCHRDAVYQGRCEIHPPMQKWEGARKGREGLPRGWVSIKRGVLASSRGANGLPQCALCGEIASEVDHILSVNEGGDSSPANLRALCIDCHEKKTSVEAIRERRQPW